MFSKQDIEKYFFAEKQLGLIFLIIGALAIVLALIFFLGLKTSFYKGVAWPLLILGLIQLLAGFNVYRKSDDNRKNNVYAYDMNPGQLKNEELSRMKKVNRSFIVILIVEMIVLITGLTMIFLFRNNAQKALLYGIGVGLAIQTVIMMLADFTAQSRATAYTKGIESFVEKFKN